ncbi:DUF2252 family protein [Rhodoferax sp. TBRC 17198]|uniref:DUF2252 family protein n=1 Tax=Rhodoferax potami TaxID=3068338 RepID=UPI0028BE7374|nr:DUF2252 family protein [Rhodoferax sp. TBRC 17198]MDT7521522.1 DUF2252 family protein [Rhodoferax sp. TBRC 17198]
MSHKNIEMLAEKLAAGRAMRKQTNRQSHLGTSDAFVTALTRHASAYADQVHRDFEVFRTNLSV